MSAKIFLNDIKKIGRGLNANRILVFSLALEEDYLEFINNADKMLTEYEALTNDEVRANANNSKSLRHDREKAEKNFTKRLLGGDKCAIIYKKMKSEQTSLYYTKVVMKVWKDSKFWDAG